MVRDFAERLKKVDQLQYSVAVSSERVDKLTQSVELLLQRQLKSETQAAAIDRTANSLQETMTALMTIIKDGLPSINDSPDQKNMMTSTPIQVHASTSEPGLNIANLGSIGLSPLISNRESLMRKMDMPVCDGKHPHGWIAQAEIYFHISQFPEDKKLPLVSLSLEGDALKWYNEELTREAFTDWREFKSRLLARFSTIKKRSPTEVIPESTSFSEDAVLHASELVQSQEVFEQKDSMTLSQFQETISMSELKLVQDKKIIGERKSDIVSQFQEMSPVSDSEVHHDLVPLLRERETSEIKDTMRPHMSVLNFKFIDVGSEVKMFTEVLDIQQSSFAYLLGDNMLHSGQMIHHHFRKQKCSKSWHFKFKNRFQTRNWVQEQTAHAILRQQAYLIDIRNLWYNCFYPVIYEALMKTKRPFHSFRMMKQYNISQLLWKMRICTNRKGVTLAESENWTQGRLKFEQLQTVSSYSVVFLQKAFSPELEHILELHCVQNNWLLMDMCTQKIPSLQLEKMKESRLIEAAQSYDSVNEIIKFFSLQTGDKLHQMLTAVQHVSVHMEMATPKYEEGVSDDVEWAIAWKEKELEVQTGVDKDFQGISREHVRVSLIQHEASEIGNNKSRSSCSHAQVGLLPTVKSIKILGIIKQPQRLWLMFQTWMSPASQVLRMFTLKRLMLLLRYKMCSKEYGEFLLLVRMCYLVAHSLWRFNLRNKHEVTTMPLMLNGNELSVKPNAIFKTHVDGHLEVLISRKELQDSWLLVHDVQHHVILSSLRTSCVFGRGVMIGLRVKVRKAELLVLTWMETCQSDGETLTSLEGLLL